MPQERLLFGKKILPHHMLTFAEQVYDILVAEIEGGRWQVDERLPGVMNLAKELRFGTKTIQTAYDRLKEEGYVRSLGYRGTYLKSRHPQVREGAGHLAVLAASGQSGDPLILWYEHVLLQRARRRNLAPEVIVLPDDAAPDPLASLAGRAGGVVSLTPFRLEPRHSGLPVVFLCPPYEDCAPRVSADVVEASRELTAEVIRAGHRRIFFSEDAVEPDPRLTQMQFQGHLEAMQRHGLPVDGDFRAAARAVRHDDPDGVAAHLRDLAARGRAGGTAAVFAGSLGRAMALVQAAPRAGVSIPGDLSVVCIGSAPVEADGARQITGMLPDFDFMADTCLDLLARQRETGRADVSAISVRMHLVPGHTLLRSSDAPAGAGFR